MGSTGGVYKGEAAPNYLQSPRLDVEPPRERQHDASISCKRDPIELPECSPCHADFPSRPLRRRHQRWRAAVTSRERARWPAGAASPHGRCSAHQHAALRGHLPHPRDSRRGAEMCAAVATAMPKTVGPRGSRSRCTTASLCRRTTALLPCRAATCARAAWGLLRARQACPPGVAAKRDRRSPPD